MSKFNRNVKEIKNQTSTLYESAKENVAEVYNKTKSKVDELAATTEKTASDLYHEGKSRFIEAESSIENTLKDSIRKQPFISVLMAAGIAYLFTKLFK